MAFLSYYIQLILTTMAPLILGGLAVWGMECVFHALVGEQSGRRLLVAATAAGTPLHEAGHAAMCVLFAHRIHDVRLLDLHDPDGELGFVQHSYNRRNYFAVLGNYFIAIGPLFTGLFAVLVILLTCFHGCFGSFVNEVTMLVESEASFGEYVRAAASLVPAMFSGSRAALPLKIVGGILLLAISLRICISPEDLANALSGMVIFAAVTLVFAVLTALFDARVRRLILASLHTFSVVVVALFLVVLLSCAVLLAIGGVFFVIRGVFGTDIVRRR